MTEAAFDPEATPNPLADHPDMDVRPAGIPTAPYPVGETFTVDGAHVHVQPKSDGENVHVGRPSEEV